jgi:glycosyltransferase involved in cell wall biosynthesis
MKIVMVQATAFVPAWGGANKSNRLVLEDLAKRGHHCSLVAPALGAHACRDLARYDLEIEKRGINRLSRHNGTDLLEWNGVSIFAATRAGKINAALRRAVDEIRPDWVLVASEDPGQLLLKTALECVPRSVVYLARTTLTLPFGPGSAMQSRSGTELLRRVSGIVAVSRYLTNYFRRWANLDSVDLPICPNGPGPFPYLGRFEEGLISMVNPCAYKGISIFAALARAFPRLSFAAVPSWGTTSKDRALLASLENVREMPPSDEIDDILRSTRVLLVPSLWAEAKANMITEAMLRGIPVLAGDVGGNAEGLLGLDFLLPVNPILSFRNQLDDQMLPVPVVPDQNLQPWLEALELLVSDRGAYEALSRASQKASNEANGGQDVSLLESYLRDLNPPRSQ